MRGSTDEREEDLLFAEDPEQIPTDPAQPNLCQLHDVGGDSEELGRGETAGWTRGLGLL